MWIIKVKCRFFFFIHLDIAVLEQLMPFPVHLDAYVCVSGNKNVYRRTRSSSSGRLSPSIRGRWRLDAQFTRESTWTWRLFLIYVRNHKRAECEMAEWLLVWNRYASGISEVLIKPCSLCESETVGRRRFQVYAKVCLYTLQCFLHFNALSFTT